MGVRLFLAVFHQLQLWRNPARHPAVFPVDLPAFFIKLLCPDDGLVVDPFAGSGTTGIAALQLGVKSILIDNNPKYFDEAINRIKREGSNLKYKTPDILAELLGYGKSAENNKEYIVTLHEKGQESITVS